MKTKKLYTAIILLSFLVIGIQPALAAILVPSEVVDRNNIVVAELNGNTYKLIKDIDEALIIQESDIILDGNGHTITGPGPNNLGVGVDINGNFNFQNGITVKDLNITGFPIGIWINNSNPGPATPKTNTLENNTIFGCTTAGIRLTSANETIVNNNTIENNTNTAGTSWGIFISTSGNTNNLQFGNTVTGNIVRNNNGGILLNSGSSFNSLVGNTVTGSTASGIFIDNQSNNNVITGNNSSSNRDGIFLRNILNSSITGNITTNNQNGIKLVNSSNNTLTNNTVSGNTVSGIFLDPSVNNQINNNNFINNTPQAYVADDSINNNLDGNHWSDWVVGSGPYIILSTPSQIEINDNSPFADPNGWIANEPPVADAGPDQTVECVCQTPEGTQVTLNGTGSSDPDMDPLTYTWTGPFVEGGGTVSGAAPTVTLNGCIGFYEITLVVNDGTDNSGPDMVIITVVDITAPVTTCPGDTTVEAMGPDGVPKDDDRIQAFLAGASATDNCDLEPIITNNAPDVFLPGDTLVTFTATDISGNSSDCQSTLTVVEAEESNLRIFPRIINRDGRLQKILAVIRFPAGTTEEDIDINQLLVLYPGDSPNGIEATTQRVVTWCRWGTLRVSVFASFPKDAVISEVPEDGPVEMMVIGRFTDGQYFYGFDNAWICSWNW